MKLIRQRYDSDCGIASLAMIGNISYSSALEILLPKRKKYESYEVSVRDLEQGLKKLSIRFREKEYIGSFLHVNTSLVVIKICQEYSHAIVWDALSKKFFDPKLPVPINDTFKIKLDNHIYNPHFLFKRNLLYLYELI